MAGTPRPAERSRGIRPSRMRASPFSTARQVLEEVAADELLRQGRATLGKPQPEPVRPSTMRASERTAVFWTTRGSARYSTPEWEKKFLSSAARMASRRMTGHLVVGDDPPVLARQLDQDLALGVVDLPDRRGLEPEEGPEVGEAAAVEVDVVDEPHDGHAERDGEDRGHDAHDQWPRRPAGSRGDGGWPRSCSSAIPAGCAPRSPLEDA